MLFYVLDVLFMKRVYVSVWSGEGAKEAGRVVRSVRYRQGGEGAQSRRLLLRRHQGTRAHTVTQAYSIALTALYGHTRSLTCTHRTPALTATDTGRYILTPHTTLQPTID